MLSARFTQFDRKIKLVDVDMFSLIWYFGLISFVVSVHSNNDTLHGGYKLNISTTMSALPSTTIPVANDCVLEVKESEISEIVELFNNDRVNVVDIHVSFSNTTHDKELSDFRVKLLNPIGREILYSLKRPEVQHVTWSTLTFNAGIRNFKLHVNESQNDCVERQKNATDFAFENMQNIVRRVNLATNYEVWYSFKETSSGKVHQICCQITKHNLPKCNLGCSTENSYLYASSFLWLVISIIMNFFVLFCFMWLLHVFLSRAVFDLEYPQYYKLKESRMSPSFILFKGIFEENGRVVSFIRKCALVGVLSYFNYLFWRRREEGWKVFTLILFVFWGLSSFISSLCGSKTTNSSILHEIKKKRKNLSADNIAEIDSGEFAGVIKVLTLPFNGKFWRETKKILCNESAAFIERARIKFRNRILRNVTLCICYVLAILINALSVSIVFLCWTIGAIYYFFNYMVEMVYVTHSFEYKFFKNVVLHNFPPLCLPFFLIFTAIAMASAIESFLLGLFLNLIYFIPYFAFFSVLTFYCGNFWKTMEEKYLVLKRLIYEACRDIQCVNNGCIPNRHPKREEKVLPVVSKELYDKIREKLLPYDTNLFYFGLKIFWAFVFLFGIFSLIDMLNEFSFTGSVQVIMTASLGVMPHIFNMVGLKTSEEEKKAQEEKLKLNVKYMVEDLLRADPELARTVLIIKQNNDTTADENFPDSEHDDDAEDPELTRLLQEVYGTTTDENLLDSQHPSDNDDDFLDPELTRGLTSLQEDNEARFCLNAPDNDNVEDPELALAALIIEEIDEAADENVHDSENVQGTSDLNPPDRDDVEELVHAEENNNTTADENVQDSGRANEAGSGLNRQNLRDNREENVHDYELVEVKCGNEWFRK